MRRIEDLMLTVSEDCKGWVKDNIRMVFSEHEDNIYLTATIYLRNHPIGYLLPDNSIEVNNDLSRSYPTVMSYAVNCILEKVLQSGFVTKI